MAGHLHIGARNIQLMNTTLVGRYRLERVDTSVDCTWLQRLELEYDEPLSNCAFNFKLRCYSAGAHNSVVCESTARYGTQPG
jgi:hypothetical protein